MTKELIVPPDVHPTTGYAHAYKVGNTVYCAGQVAMAIDRSIVGVGDFEAQCVQAYENLKRVLAAAGATMNGVVKTTTYITNLDHLPIMRSVRPRFFGDPGPAGTLLVISSLAHPDYLIEVEAIAAIDSE